MCDFKLLINNSMAEDPVKLSPFKMIYTSVKFKLLISGCCI